MRDVAMKLKYRAIASLAVLVSLVSVPMVIEANAHSFGFGMHGSNHFRPAHRHRAFNQSQWWYGGYYAYPPYTYGNMDSNVADGYSTTPTVVYVAEPRRALTCEFSQQVKTVPAEGGGTRDITITR